MVSRGAWDTGLVYIVFIFAVLALCSHTMAATVQAGDCIITGPGEFSDCTITLDKVGSGGFMGFEITAGLTNPGIAEITAVKFPSWAGLNSRGKVPSDSLLLKGADGSNKIKAGDRNVVLVTLTIRGDAAGESDLLVNVTRMEEESGSTFPAEGKPGKVTVKGAAGTGEPTDPALAPPAVSLPVFTPAQTPSISYPDELTPIPPEPTVNNAEEDQESPSPVDPVTGGVTPSATPTPVLSPVPTVSEEIGNEEGKDTPAFEDTVGAVSIDSSPAGAGVRVDGELRGTTPLVLSLAPGTYALVVEGEEGRRWEGNITIAAGRLLDLPLVVLESPAYYTLTTLSGPHGSVYPAGETRVRAGESVTVTFLPEPGYALRNVSLDGFWIGPKDELEIRQVSADHRVEGIFAQIPPPVADFSVNVTSGTVPLAVQFLDLSSGRISGWDWNFGDGSGSGERQPIHVYSAAGNYSVSLKVCGSGGCDSTSRERLVQVLPEEPLAANFTANVTCGQAPLHVLFHDVSIGTVELRVWEFGDGTNATVPDPLHEYSLPGMYNVSLTIRRGELSDTVEKPGFIDVAPAVIGGSVGYIRVIGNVEGAKVYFDADYKGTLSGGMLVVPVYTTATPYRMINVRAVGYLPSSAPLTRYPRENETVDYTIEQVPYFRSVTSLDRFTGNSTSLNLTSGRLLGYPHAESSE